MQPDLRSSPYEDYTHDPLMADIVVGKRERQMLDLAAQGYSNQSIATCMKISPATVDQHLNHVARKLGLRSSRETPLNRRTVLIIWWARVRAHAEECGRGVVVPGARMFPRAAQRWVARA